MEKTTNSEKRKNADSESEKEANTDDNFSIKEFKNNLKTPEALSCLRNFVSHCIKENNIHDYVKEYIDSKGTLLEILQSLNYIEQKNFKNAILVFQAFNLILLRLIKNFDELKRESEETCQKLLTQQMEIINSSFKPETPSRYKKVVLKLLTSMVTFSSHLAKEILLHVKLDQSIIEVLTRRSKLKDSVRNCFIKFCLSFIIDGNISNIKSLFEQKNLLLSIVENLVWDSSEIISLVLVTFKNKILLNSSIIKTTKLHIFNTNIIKNLINLYNWKGHKNSEEEKGKVLEIVHECLLVLCTSHKHGVIFHDKSLGLDAKSNNSLMLTVLESLEAPWSHKYVSELIIKITEVCPDLYNFVIKSTESALPTDTPSLKWLNLINFLKKLIQTKTLFRYFNELNEMKPKQIINIIESFYLNSFLLKQISIYLKNDETLQKLAYFDLYSTILKELNEFLNNLKLKIDKNIYFVVKNHIYDYLLKHTPSIDILLNLWQSEIKVENKYYKDFNLKLVLLEVINIYFKFNPVSSEKLNVIFTPSKFLANFEKGEIESKSDKENEDENQNEIILSKHCGDLLTKGTELFLSIDSNIFSPDKDYFSEYMTYLFKYLDKEILSKVLSSTKIFDSNTTEIDIWLKYFNNQISDIFIKSLKKSYKNYDKLQMKIDNIKITTNFANIELANLNEIFDKLELNEDIFELSSCKYKIITPFLLTFLTKVEIADEINYLNCVLLDLFHSQTNPSVFLSVVLSNDKISKSLLNYFKSWYNSKPKILKFEKAEFKINVCLSEKLLGNENVNDLFDQQIPLDSLKNLFEMTIFYYTQLATMNLLEDNNNFLIIINKILEKFENNQQFQLLSVIFYHPIIQKLYTPLHIKKTNQQLITLFICSIVNNQNLTNNQLTLFYQQKLFSSILKSIKNYSNKKYLPSIDLFNNLLKTFELNLNQTQQILQQLIKLPIDCYEEKSIFYLLLLYCLNKQIEISNINIVLDNMLSDETFKQILNIYFNLFNYQINDFDLIIYKYLMKYPHFLAGNSRHLYKTLIRSKKNEIRINLICYLLEQNVLLQQKLLKTNFLNEDKEIVVPVLNVLLKSNNLDELLVEFYLKHEVQFFKYIEKPDKIPKTFEKNEIVILRMIKLCFQQEKAIDFFQKPFKNLNNILNVHHVRYLEEILSKIESPNETILYNYLNYFLDMLIIGIKTNSNLNEICMKLDTFLIKSKLEIKKEFLARQIWDKFLKITLKFSLNVDNNAKNVLETFKNLCEKIDGNEETISFIHEMVISHSEFLNLILSNKEVKTPLLKLLSVIYKKDPRIITEKLVPLFLSAYNGTLIENDKIVLSILKLFEENAIDFSKYKPLVWGEVAIKHYSIKNQIETSLWRQLNMGEICDLLQSDIVLATLEHFDIKRSFFKLGEFHMLNVNQYHLTIDDEKLKKSILNRPKFFDKSKNSISRSVGYDPCFYLPLFINVLSNENVVKCYKFTQTGGLSLTLIALASNCSAIRNAAYCVLARFYTHLESYKNKDKYIWLQFIDSIRRGLNEYDLKENKSKQISYISALFLARAALILTEPLHQMYIPISNFLFVRETFSFKTVPEFLQFLNNSEIQHKTIRQWLLMLIRDGLKSNMDILILFKSYAYKFLFDIFYICDKTSEKLILQILEKSLDINADTLIEKFGFLSWLNYVIQVYNDDFSSAFIIFLSKLVNKQIDKYNQFVYLLFMGICLDNVTNEHFLMYLKHFYLLVKRSNLQVDETFLLNLIEVSEKFCTFSNAKYYLKYGVEFSNVDLDNDSIGKYLELLIIFYKNQKAEDA